MSKTNEVQAARKFSYRNITKDFQVPAKEETTSKQFHLELGEHNEVVIIEDRPIDWVEFSNKDVDRVGLANVLDIARRTGQDLSQFAYSDNEALDLSGMDPMDPQSINSTVASSAESLAKLQGVAEQLGVSVADLITAAVNGSLSSLISEHTASEAAKDGE